MPRAVACPLLLMPASNRTALRRPVATAAGPPCTQQLQSAVVVAHAAVARQPAFGGSPCQSPAHSVAQNKQHGASPRAAARVKHHIRPLNLAASDECILELLPRAVPG